MRIATVLTMALVSLPLAAAAQQEPMAKAFDLERRGDYAGAAEAYRKVLQVKPADAAALLGLERVLLPTNRSREILPLAQAASASNPSGDVFYGVLLRAWAAADQPDSMRAVALRWARAMPDNEAPYREWGAAALLRRDRPGALEAYASGRERLRRPDALAAEMAQLAVADADFPTAVREWVQAIRLLPGYRATALATLGQAPQPLRPEVLRQLAQERGLAARRLEAELRVRWGDPAGGFEVLREALPEERVESVQALRDFLDLLQPLRSGAALAAQGRTLEAMASRMSGAEGARLRLRAAQVYGEAGDREAARRMLAGLMDDRNSPSGLSAGAGATLITILIGEGKLAEAQQRLAEFQPKLGGGVVVQLRRRLVAGWLQAGELARADSALAADSTVEGLALRGRIRLYQGDLAGASEAFRAAGPFAGNLREATERAILLGLLQSIEADTLPALGRSLWKLHQGDSAGAAARLERVAEELPAPKGGAELRLLAGRIWSALGKSGDAERLLRAAAGPDAPGTAPAAELALADLMIRQGRHDSAVAQLEHLILTYPHSVLVPQARRALDQARGAVPRT